MIDYSKYEVWFITGSQHLYGPETLKQIDANSRKLVAEMNRDAKLPLKLIAKPVLTTADAIESLCLEANASNKCVGLVMWMHTFSPAKMWIGGLTQLAKPFAHLHTQMNRDIPWDKIDMDFMNLNQSAHGDREFGYICTRLGKNRKVIAGHWTDGEVRRKLNVWMRAAMARQDCRGMSIARFGDNMRNVAVTEGDKVEAEIKFGYRVNGYGVGDVVEQVEKVSKAAVEDMCAEYDRMYTMAADLKPKGKRRDALRHCAKIELGMRKFLTAGNFKAFTDTFENLHGLVQLPGLAAQRLMADGYGFGAEGDWKHAALVRSFKVMGAGLAGGASFMEDYTYHLDPKCGMVLGAHMLEVCPTVSRAKASCEIHPLGIGGKDDPVRLVFNADTGDALNATVVDMGNRFRMIVNTVKVVAPKKPLPKLPVARALWVPQPDLATSASAWILAGGAHHTAFSQAIGVEHVEDFAEMFDVEFVLIDKDATISGIKKELRANSAYYDGKSAK